MAIYYQVVMRLLRLPERDFATGRSTDDAPPPRGPFARFQQHAGPDLSRALSRVGDLGNLHVRQPQGPPGLAFDDPAPQPVSHLEREVGAARHSDSLRAPSAHARVELARAPWVAGVQLQVDNRIGRSLG